MFDWLLFLSLVVVSAPRILAVTPSVIKMLRTQIMPMVPAGKKVPQASAMTAVSMLQSLVLVAAAAALGTSLAPRVGLRTPLFPGPGKGTTPVGGAAAPADSKGRARFGGALVIVGAYYLVFRPRLGPETVCAMEGLRMRLGLSGRILYGGIVEEVLFRWGVITIGVWLGALITGTARPVLVWVVILLSGLLFGIGHLPSYKRPDACPHPCFSP